jgi:F-type H+-transporting ATPase subunit a
MHEHELWVTALLNHFFAAPAQWVLNLAGIPAGEHGPWSNFMAMEILVLLIIVLAAAWLRARLSVDRPGIFQLTIEAIWGFLAEQAEEIIGHGFRGYVPFFFALFMFILVSNLIGIIPTFEAPTMYYYVPAGIAMASFFYYNGHGFRVQGPIGYLKHFAGPMWWLAWFMFPLEIISHCIRPMSLTIRLTANMIAGEQVTNGFMQLVSIGLPVVLMGLHVFVSFVQAFIFTALSIVYVGGAVTHEEH